MSYRFVGWLFKADKASMGPQVGSQSLAVEGGGKAEKVNYIY
jgi:hypothetical protein